MKKTKQKFPPGWNEKRVKELIAHYENQTENEEFADIEAARKAEDITMMAIPIDLVHKIRALLAGRQSARLRLAAISWSFRPRSQTPVWERPVFETLFRPVRAM